MRLDLTLHLEAHELDAALLAHLQGLLKGHACTLQISTLPCPPAVGHTPQPPAEAMRAAPASETTRPYAPADFEEMRRELFEE